MLFRSAKQRDKLDARKRLNRLIETLRGGEPKGEELR
jgi:hypothetical protein